MTLRDTVLSSKAIRHVTRVRQWLKGGSDPIVMGILNATPDSFYDGGRYVARTAALARAHKMVNAGARIIDVGGESTRPGADPVSVQQEAERVVPLIEALVAELDVPISIDTRKVEVMRYAFMAGACMVNDVTALRAEGSAEFVAKQGTPVCLMHAAGTPKTMQSNPQYRDVVKEVIDFLERRIEVCLSAGMDRSDIIIDPGFGYAKNLFHNLQLLKFLSELKVLGCHILVGLSRKHMIGSILQQAHPEDRLYGGLAATVIAALNGARIIRTHDVGPTVEALKVVSAVISPEIYEKGNQIEYV